MHYIFSLIFVLSTLSVHAKTFIYCSEGSPSAFNPQITTDGTSHNATAYTIYNRLVEFKYGTTEIVPALASSWKISKDRRTYTFQLRKGVKFQQTDYFKPSRDFNAEDVLFSYNRFRDKAHPFHLTSGGIYEYWEAMEMGKLVESIKKIDDYTVEFRLSHPEAPFLANMAMSFMSVLSKEYGDQLIKQNKKQDIDQLPIGTGPFAFKKYVKDTLIRYSAHNQFWDGQPKIDKLVFSITPDASVRYQKLKTGECHLIIEPAPADLEDMQSNPRVKLINGPGLNVGYLALNTQKAPFNNPLVRKAIQYALNRQSYIKAIYLGHAMQAKNPLPPTIWSYNDKIKDFNYNPKKAKELLKKAGLKNGFSTDLWWLPVSRPYNPAGKKMAEMMQADLAQVGIQAKLVSFDWPTYLSKSRNGEHSMLQMGWTGDNGDPDNFLNVLLSCSGVKAGSNFARWCNKSFDKLITEAKKISDQKKRTKLYEKAQAIFKREAPWVTLAHSVIFRAMSPKVEGYKIDPLGSDIFRYVDIK